MPGTPSVAGGVDATQEMGCDMSAAAFKSDKCHHHCVTVNTTRRSPLQRAAVRLWERKVPHREEHVSQHPLAFHFQGWAAMCRTALHAPDYLRLVSWRIALSVIWSACSVKMSEHLFSFFFKTSFLVKCG